LAAGSAARVFDARAHEAAASLASPSSSSMGTWFAPRLHSEAPFTLNRIVKPPEPSFPARVAGMVSLPVTRVKTRKAMRREAVTAGRAAAPGWTPLVLVAGGVVLEQGGMLSHGAVVAREYGLPGVVNVEGATTRIADGQVITVDGRRGLVFLA
jgi:phosphohistidine swiveling domain-containing protein